jgi:hypothetical protein
MTQAAQVREAGDEAGRAQDRAVVLRCFASLMNLFEGFLDGWV